jgi:hypothetical protein
MQRHQPRLAVLALADGKQIAFGINIGALQMEGFMEA